MAETFDWLKPSILWQPGSTDMLRQEFFRPTLLEFGTDAFMEDFLAAAAAPRADAFGNAVERIARQGAKLKLFQPAHGRFYLTSASLCCRLPGFPDREVLLGEGENIFFVLRKKVDGVEYAWNVNEANKGWQSLGTQLDRVLPNEERLPLFQTMTAQSRAIFFGYVPVASQDTYAAAPTDSIVDYGRDQRLDELDARFNGPLANPLLFGKGAAEASPIIQLRISVYLLLDLWEYFDEYLSDVARALKEQTTSQLTGKKRDLTDYLKAQRLGGTLDLATALGQAGRQRAELNKGGDLDEAGLAALGFNNDYNLKVNRLTGLNDLSNKVKDALDVQAVAKPVVVPKLATAEDDRYVLRFVYERAQCDPPHRYISRPTEAFALAAFMDPDAPARTVRIGLPQDVSIAGLRKFKKNVGFLISKELNKKLEGIKGQEEKVLDNAASNTDGSSASGFICSFSLPIITLCAFILLMIIVILLNIVFWWIPLLKICFPLKAGKG
ncbi:MAG TPA: hypothetical protein VM911_14495 [Pyrinomonadaceae bacterium]|nr:hypothetical protein [Pyrinomonadaceae bacterium]